MGEAGVEFTNGKRPGVRSADRSRRQERSSPEVVLAAACKSSERFQVAFHKLHDEFVVAWMTPAIALDATDQHLTVMIDFH
jgi:hypothetical protein